MHRKNAYGTQDYPDNKDNGDHLDITEVYTITGQNYLILQMETKRKFVKTWQKHYVQHMFPAADT